jgi:cholesterol transport system auxiliary component
MKKILPALALALFAGCSIHAPAITEYSLISTESLNNLSSITTYKTIRLNAPVTLSSLATKSIYYTSSKQESGSYLYSIWSDTPSSMIENTLFLTLQQSNLFSIVAPSASWAKTDYLLESNIALFHHRINSNGTSDGVIDTSYRLVDTTTKKVIASKHFFLTQPAESNNAKGGVVALQKGLQVLNLQTLQWLEVTLAKQSDTQ